MSTAFVYKKYYKFNDYYPHNLPADFTSYIIFDHSSNNYVNKTNDIRNITLDDGTIIEGFNHNKLIYKMCLIFIILILLFITCSK